MSESRILVRLLRMYFTRNWEFGSALSKHRNFGGRGVFEHPKPPLGTPQITVKYPPKFSNNVTTEMTKQNAAVDGLLACCVVVISTYFCSCVSTFIISCYVTSPLYVLIVLRSCVPPDLKTINAPFLSPTLWCV